MALRDIVLGTIGTVGLAGMIYGLDGVLRSDINEARTPTVQRIEQINRELWEIKGYDLIRDRNLQDKYTALKGEYDTFMRKPLVRQEYKRAKDTTREFNKNSIIAVLFGIPFAISVAYYGGNYRYRKWKEY